MINPYASPKTQLSTSNRRVGIRWGWLVYTVFIDLFMFALGTMVRIEDNFADMRIIDWLEFPLMALFLFAGLVWSLNRKVFGQRFWKGLFWIVIAHAIYSIWDNSWEESFLLEMTFIAAFIGIFYVPHLIMIWKYAMGKNNMWAAAPTGN